MAKRKKNKKNEDEVLLDISEVSGQAGDFYERNQKTIMSVVVGLVVVVGGYLLYQSLYVRPQQAKALEKMAEAEYQFGRDSFGLALANPGNDYPGFAAIVDEFGGTDAGNAALYYAGVSCLNRGEFDAAISYLEDFSPDGTLMSIMKPGVLGDAYCEKGDLEKGLGFYKKAAGAGENQMLTPYYLKKVAMLSEKLGKNEDALKAWKSLKADYPQSNEGRDADKFIIMLQ